MIFELYKSTNNPTIGLDIFNPFYWQLLILGDSQDFGVEMSLDYLKVLLYFWPFLHYVFVRFAGIVGSVIHIKKVLTKMTTV